MASINYHLFYNVYWVSIRIDLEPVRARSLQHTDGNNLLVSQESISGFWSKIA